MKKIALVLSIVLLLSGCGNDQMMTCTRESTYNGLTSGTEYQITYNNDTVKRVMITYNYNQDNHIDGVNTDTDGTTNDTDARQDDDGIIDGVVGDTIDGLIGGMYNTIIDLSGLKERHNNQVNNINIEGFTSKVEDNTDNSYKIVYDLDLTKINDTDIKRFNVDRDYNTIIDNYTTQGLTCK